MQNSESARRRTRAFTLVELLVVISIIGLLIALLLPALGKARFQAMAVVCGSQMRQVGIAVAQYANDHDGFVPPVALGSFSSHNVKSQRKALGTIDFSQPNSQWGNDLGVAAIYPYYLPDWRGFYCPSDPSHHDWSYKDKAPEHWEPNVLQASETLAGRPAHFSYDYYGGIGFARDRDGSRFHGESGEMAKWVVWKRIDEPSKTLMTDLAYWDNAYSRYYISHGGPSNGKVPPGAGMNFLYQDTRVEWASLPHNYQAGSSSWQQTGDLMIRRRSRTRAPVGIVR